MADDGERLVERLTAVVDLWRRLSDDDLPIDEILDSIPARAMEVLGADATALHLRVGDELVPRSSAGYLTIVPTVSVDGTLAGRALTEGRVIRCGDYPHDLDLSNPVVPPDGSRSFVVAPVDGADGVVGVISVADRRAHHFDEADERSLELLARALGAVVRRSAVEDALRSSEQRFRLVARATTDAIYDWDIVGDEVWWSDGVQTLFGHSRDVMQADVASWAGLLHPDDADRALTDLVEFMEDPVRENYTASYRFRRADGTYAIVTDRAFAVRDEHGATIRLLGGMADMTAQHEAESRAMHSQRLEAVGQLTGGVAHDFNNLLTVVLGNTELLIGELDDRPDLVEFAEMTRTAALRGSDLSHRLLAFARRQPLEPEPVDVNRLLGHLDPLLRRTIPEDVELEVVRGAGLWAAFIDAGQLESALLNLCLNARDAMPTGGRLTIESANAFIDQQYADRHHDVTPGQYVMVAVSDTGTGIAPEVVERVVEPFFTTKAKGVGSGLGLSMVHGFVKQSRGHFKIYTELDEGTTIRLYLPRSLTGAVNTDEQIQVRHDHQGTERILLVEDDAAVRQLAHRHLAGLGYQVIAAAGGPEALDVLRGDEPIDLIFTDVVMPGGLGGRELAEAASELRPGIRVLYTSGYTENAIVHHGRLDPGVELLGKPYRLAELGRRVRAVLDAPSPPSTGAPR